MTLKTATSLWSADLANLERDLKRAEPYSDLFHIDVADGHYAPTLLFFPDLVAALRPKTEIPFEIHLITEKPEMWVDPFADAGANRLIFYPDAVRDPAVIQKSILDRGMGVGLSLTLEQPVASLDPYWENMEVVVVLGTGFGVKGVKDVASEAYAKIEELVREREARGLKFEIEADGAIRKHTVPRLREAGADIVVPGSLLFDNDMAEISKWLKSL